MSMKELHETREKFVAKVAELNDELKQAKKEIEAIDYDILDFLRENGMDHFKLGEKRYEFKTETVPEHIEWDELYAWIMENQAPFLLQRRVTLNTLLEFIDSGQMPAGITMRELDKLRVVKA